MEKRSKNLEKKGNEFILKNKEKNQIFLLFFLFLDIITMSILYHAHQRMEGLKNSHDKAQNQAEEIRNFLERSKNELSALAQKVEKQNKFTLSKADFEKYFAGENFQQRSIGNCRLLAAIDSLVSRGKYEEVIRKSVKRDKEGNFSIRLPLWSAQGKEITVTKEELKDQININGSKAILVSGKEGIKAIVTAYGKLATGKNGNDQFDYHNLTGGLWHLAFNTLLEGVEVFIQGRSKWGKKNEKEDPKWTYDKVFMETFKKTLENFNPKSDLLTISVYQKREGKWDRGAIKDSYELLGHYSKSNHSISVEKTFQKNWTLYIQLSNPRNSNRSYTLSFNELLKSTSQFYLATNNSVKYNFLWKKKSDTKEDNSPREFLGKKATKPISLNQVIQTTGEFNKQESIWRGDVIVEQTSSNSLTVKWRGKDDGKVTREKEKLTLKIGSLECNINKNKLSKTFKNKVHEQYPIFLYSPRILLFVQKIRSLYIDGEKGKWTNPFQLDKYWDILFIPNPNKIWSDNNIKNIGANLVDVAADIAGIFWEKGKEIKSNRYSSEQRTIKVLKNRYLLWIDNYDKETKETIVNFLNALYQETAKKTT